MTLHQQLGSHTLPLDGGAPTACVPQVNALRKEGKEQEAEVQEKQQQLEGLQGVLQRVQSRVTDLFVQCGGTSVPSASLVS